MEISYLSSVALYDPLKITMKPNACDFVTLLRSVVLCFSPPPGEGSDGCIMLMSKTDAPRVWTRCPKTDRDSLRQAGGQGSYSGRRAGPGGRRRGLPRRQGGGGTGEGSGLGAECFLGTQRL